MKKGIWWLFGGIGLSAIVFAVLLATKVVSFGVDNQSNNDNGVKDKNEKVCEINKKIDDVDYSFVLKQNGDRYFLSVYQNGERSNFLYNADVDYSNDCNYNFDDYVNRKKITADGEYSYYLYSYPFGVSDELFVVVDYNKNLYTILHLSESYGIYAKVEDGKSYYNRDELSFIDDDVRIDGGKLYDIDRSYNNKNVNIDGCDEAFVYDEYVYEFANGTFTKKKSGQSYFDPQVKC